MRAVAVLGTRRGGACIALVVPSTVILLTAIRVIVEVSGPVNPVMWPVAVAAVLVIAAMARSATLRDTSPRRG